MKKILLFTELWPFDYKMYMRELNLVNLNFGILYRPTHFEVLDKRVCTYFFFISMGYKIVVDYTDHVQFYVREHSLEFWGGDPYSDRGLGRGLLQMLTDGKKCTNLRKCRLLSQKVSLFWVPFWPRFVRKSCLILKSVRLGCPVVPKWVHRSKNWEKSPRRDTTVSKSDPKVVI